MAKKAKRSKGLPIWPVYLLLVVIFAFYIYFQHVQTLSTIFGAALFFVIAVLISLELIDSIREGDYVRNVVELVIAIGVILLFWFALKFALNTNYPLDVVPSCSMLPNLHRGDMILLQGTGGSAGIKAPVIDVSAAAYNNMVNNMSSEQLLCVAYSKAGGMTNVSQTLMPNYSVGLYQNIAGRQVIVPQEDQTGLITYTCGVRRLQFADGVIENEVYTSAITIAGTTIMGDANNTRVVYQTVPWDAFYRLGDRYVVHRVYAIIDADGNYYTITKGDNNAGLDLEYGNLPANMSQIEGKVIASIPYLGYLKLILSNQFSEPAGCDSYPIN